MSLDRFDGTFDDQAPNVVLEAENGTITVPDGSLLFGADFQRDGHDLLLVNEGASTIRIQDYFLTDPPAPIFAPNGAQLTGELVARLAGPMAPGQYAQAGGGQRGGDPIGQVETIDGVATVQRSDGSIETLDIGMKIFQNDVVETAEGAGVSLTFADGTIFTLASASRMVIDELIYDPSSDSNSASFSLVQGSFVFIAGQVAKTGGMDVNTPSATMGIRGTSVLAKIVTVDGEITTEVRLLRDADGSLGQIELRALDGTLIETINVTDTRWEVTTEDGDLLSVERTAVDEDDDRVIIADAFTALQSAANRIAAGETFVTLTSTGSALSDGFEEDASEGSVDVDPIDEPIIDDTPDAPGAGGNDGGGGPVEANSELPGLDATDLVVEGQEDAGVEGDGIEGDVDVGVTGGLTFEIISGPDNGTATIDNDGNFTYVPEENFNGTDSFDYRVTDSDGMSAIGTVFVEVAPVNDPPEFDDSNADTFEDGVLVGSLAATDIDGDPLTYFLVTDATNGELTLLPDGTYSYLPDDNFEGTDSFEVRVEDPDGESDTATVFLTVTGVNDTPKIQPVDVEGAVTEGSLSDTGSITFTDVDLADRPVATEATKSVTAVASNGTTPLVLTAVQLAAIEAAFSITNAPTNTNDGSVTWDYTIAESDINFLGAGEVVTATFTITVTDEEAETATQDVTITITGVNDAPTITGTTSGDVTENDPTTATGTLTVADPDTGESFAEVVAAGTASDNGYGTYAVAASGGWEYTLDSSNATVQALGAGETTTDTFEVTSQDGTTSETVTITITGVNDAPTITGTVSGDVTENDPTTATGSLTVADPDTGESFAEVVAAGTASDNGYGTYAVAASGAWEYTLDSGNATVQALGAGETTTDTFEVTSQDGTTSETVTITITGVNDAPTITGTASGDVTEDDPTTATGTLTVADTDSGESFAEAVAAGTASDNGYGTYEVSASGAWEYTLDSGNATVQALGAGETTTDTFEVTSQDGTTSETVTITITGVNDAPTITGTASGDVTEDDPTTATGTLTVTDTDTGESFAEVVAAGTASDNGYGTYEVSASGAWEYTLDSGNATVQALGAGETTTDTFEVTSQDGATSETVTITITGVNDAPTITGTASGDVTEDDPTTATGTLTVADTDSGESFAEVVAAGTASDNGYGTYAVAASGAWEYTLDSSNVTVQSLGAGETTTDTFEVTSQDGTTSETVTITITGINDAPTITGTASGDVTEDDPTTATGTLTVTDTDTGEGFAEVVAAGTASDNGYGTYAVSASGAWEYTLDSGNATVQALGAGETTTDTFEVTSQDGATSETVTITITGVNDAPTIDPPGDAASGELTEDDEVDTVGDQLTAQDAEGDDITWEIDGSVEGAYGILSIDDDGNWLYTIDDIQTNSLSEGEIVTDTFDVFATDGVENSDSQTITVSIIGNNDAPDLPAENIFETAQDTPITDQIAATDPEGDSLSYELVLGEGFEAENGTVILLDNGEFTYEPDEGFAGFDTFTYLVSDGNGGSTQGEITIAVESGDSGGDNPVDVTLNVDPAEDAPAGSVVFDVNEATTSEINIVFALDGSGSISDSDWNAMITSIEGALTELQTTYAGSETTVTVGFTVFGSNATEVVSFDLFNETGTAGDPRDGWSEELTALRDEQPRSLTNWGAALDRTDTYLDSTDPNAQNFLFFITDGLPSGNDSVWEAERDELVADHSIIIEAFGLGPAFTNTGGSPTAQAVASLNNLDSDGAYTALEGPEDLEAALLANPAFNPTLVSLTVALGVDGGESLIVADETSRALTEEGIDLELAFAEIEGVADDLGDANRFSVQGTYDLDGDGVADITLFTSEVLGKSDTAVTIPNATDSPAAFLTGSDLLFGSDFADDISSGAGNDLVVSYDGADTVNAGTGIDTVLAGAGDDLIIMEDAGATRPAAEGGDGDVMDGGAGQDTLSFEFTNDVLSNLLDDVTIRDIETLDMNNGVTNTLRLSLADVVDMSSDSNALLDGLGIGAVSDSVVIYGDDRVGGVASDFLHLENDVDGVWTLADSDVDAQNGEFLDIWEYTSTDGSSTVLATLGVDTDIEVVVTA